MPSTRSIAFVANTSWSVYKFRLYLIKKLIENGFDLYILAPRDPYTALFEGLPGLTFIELTQYRGKSISPFHDLKLMRELAGHYRRLQPDIIFHYTIKANIFGSIAAARTGIPSISVLTGLGYAFANRNWLQASVQVLYRHALQKNEAVWFLNEDDRQIFLREKLLRKEKTFVLPGEGVDTVHFYAAPYLPSPPAASHGRRSSHEPAAPGRPPLQEPAAPGPQSQPPATFLLIARIILHKGVREYVEAARLLKDKGLAVRLQLLGFFDEDSPVAISRQQVLAWEQEGLITYLGHTDDVAPFIAAADCIVLPSYREGLPLSLLEGASMAKALIATDVAGCRDLISDTVNGYLCKKKDAADLAAKMEQYYNLPASARQEMGIAGRNKVLARFTREIVADIYLDKINNLVPSAVYS